MAGVHWRACAYRLLLPLSVSNDLKDQGAEAAKVETDFKVVNKGTAKSITSVIMMTRARVIILLLTNFEF